MRLTRAAAVARFELGRTVRKPGFILMTLGFPLLLSIPFVVPMLMGGNRFQRIAKPAPVPQKVAVLDESGLLQGWLAEQGATATGAWAAMPRTATKEALPQQVALVESLDAGQEKVRNGEADAFLFVSRDYLKTGSVMEYFIDREGKGYRREKWIMAVMSNVLATGAAGGRLDRLLEPANVQAIDLDSKREASITTRLKGALTSLVMMLVFMTAIFTSSGYLLSGLEEEKENRVFEVLITVIEAEELLWGKLVGLGAAGLMQVGVWGAGSLTLALLMAEKGVIKASMVVIGLPFFVAGFLLYGALMLGTGSLGRTARQSQQLAAIWAVVAVVPMFFANPMLTEVTPVTARVFAYFPLTAPLTALSMWSEGLIHAFELPLSLAVLIVSCHFVVRFSARLVRTGYLIQGKDLNPREIWHWMKQAG